jgi:UPF0716 protein FxsA
MPFIIFFLLISLPVLEVASIVQMSRWAGPVGTFLLLAASITFGAFLIRSQSLVVGRRVMEAMRTGVPPEQPLLDSGMISLAGVLFMIPGFFTDLLAICLLIPAARRWIWRGMAFSLRGRVQSQRAQPRPEPQPQKPRRAEDVIDVEFTEVPRDQGGSESHAHRDDSPWNKPL